MKAQTIQRNPRFFRAMELATTGLQRRYPDPVDRTRLFRYLSDTSQPLRYTDMRDDALLTADTFDRPWHVKKATVMGLCVWPEGAEGLLHSMLNGWVEWAVGKRGIVQAFALVDWDGADGHEIESVLSVLGFRRRGAALSLDLTELRLEAKNGTV